MFLFTQNFGAAFIDFFDILVGGVLVDGLRQPCSKPSAAPDWLDASSSPTASAAASRRSQPSSRSSSSSSSSSPFSRTPATWPAPAFVMDRLMRALGLPGKAFVPLLVGFGCNVPAIMATRTMDRALRPHHHDHDGSVHELRRPSPGLRALRHGVLPDQRPEPRVRLSTSSASSPPSSTGLLLKQHRPSGRRLGLRDGDPAVPHPDRQGRDAAHLGPPQGLRAARRPASSS